MPEKEVLTAVEVAEILRVTKPTIYQLARKGVLPSFRVGRALRFNKEEIQQYIKSEKAKVLE